VPHTKANNDFRSGRLLMLLQLSPTIPLYYTLTDRDGLSPVPTRPHLTHPLTDSTGPDSPTPAVRPTPAAGIDAREAREDDAGAEGASSVGDVAEPTPAVLELPPAIAITGEPNGEPFDADSEPTVGDAIKPMPAIAITPEGKEETEVSHDDSQPVNGDTAKAVPVRCSAMPTCSPCPCRHLLHQYHHHEHVSSWWWY
jgi:hypothetical protein